MSAYETITSRIVGLLDKGVVPWRKPWHAESMAPRNLSGRRYRGINLLMTLSAGYTDPRWATFNQIRKAGGSVRKGEKSTPVILWKFLDKTDEETGEPKRIPYARVYSVFNVEQCDNLNLPMLAPVQAHPQAAVAEAEAIADGMPDRPVIRYGGARAFYTPTTDVVTLPKKETFESAPDYYATLFHELGHSTGAERRVGRAGVVGFDHFGSGRYAREELVAELTSCFLCGEAGIEPETIENQAAYLASWRRTLQDDPRAIVVAAGAAQRAADFILGRTTAEQGMAA